MRATVSLKIELVKYISEKSSIKNAFFGVYPPVIHIHPGKSISDIWDAEFWFRVAHRALGVHIDQAHSAGGCSIIINTIALLSSTQ